MTAPLYFDYAATTPVDTRVAARMSDCLNDPHGFGNPASQLHDFGLRAEALVEQARQQVAELIGANAQDIVWTSGATEADNLAIIGAARFRESAGRHIVTSMTEHPAVLDACRYLAAQGFKVTFLVPERSGIIQPQQVADALTDTTTLVSLMQVNNEIGVVQDVMSIGKICRDHGTLFHVDAAQSACHLPLDVSSANIDLLSLSAQKMYGPKGVGALYLNRNRIRRVEPLMFGGSQEFGLRPGTVPTHQVVGFGEACRIVGEGQFADSARIAGLRDRLWTGLRKIPGVLLNGDAEQRVCHILSVSVTGVEGESLHYGVRELAVSAGSACTSFSDAPSAVLRCLGREDQLARASVRFSLGRQTTAEQVDYAVDCFTRMVTHLRAMAPKSAQASA